jgi:predicted PurR-regulated permease PerM
MQSVQALQSEAPIYEEQALVLADSTLRWMKTRMGVDGGMLLRQYIASIPVADVIQGMFFSMFTSMMDAFFIMLMVLYLLFEAPASPASHGSRSSRRNATRIANAGSDSAGDTAIESGMAVNEDASAAARRVRAGMLTVDDRLARAGNDPADLLNSQSRRRSSGPTLKQKIDSQVQTYITMKTLISIVVAIGVWIFLGPVLRIKTPHLFGIFTFLLNYIPNIGPIAATVLPMPFVILDPNNEPVVWLLAFLGPAAVHAVVGNFVEPALFGRSLELHPVVVLMSLAFWFALWVRGSADLIHGVIITMHLLAVCSHQLNLERLASFAFCMSIALICLSPFKVTFMCLTTRKCAAQFAQPDHANT